VEGWELGNCLLTRRTSPLKKSACESSGVGGKLWGSGLIKIWSLGMGWDNRESDRWKKGYSTSLEMKSRLEKGGAWGNGTFLGETSFNFLERSAW